MKYSNAQIMRGKQGFSQEQASQALNINRAYLSQLETYKCPMTDDMKSKMSKLYQCNIKELFPA